MCQYTSPGRIYHIFSGIPSSFLEAIPSSFSCFLSWLLFLLLLGFSYFQAVQHMWRRYWARNRNLLNLLVGCFIFAHECVITKKSCHDISLHKNYTFPFLFLCQMFVSTSRPFHCELSCHRTCILAHNSSWCNILQQYVHIFCSMYSTCFILYPYNLYYCAHIYHSCSTLPWFGVRVTPSLNIFLLFYWIAH